MQKVKGKKKNLIEEKALDCFKQTGLHVFEFGAYFHEEKQGKNIRHQFCLITMTIDT